MKQIQQFLTSLLLLASLLSAAQSKKLPDLISKYNSHLNDLNQGIGILIKKDGNTTFANAGKFNFNQHTVFNIGSGTKKITAILLLQEIEKGNLALTDSIGKYLDPIEHVDGSLTIETLLRHRSGLGELVGRNFEGTFFAKSDSLYNSDFLGKIPENNPEMIGKHEYCNTNYILLGHLLEKITDQNYTDLLRERIFEPCGMKESYPYVSKNLKNLAPPVHNKENVFAYLDYRFFAKYAFSAGSIASTLSDMAKFYEHLFEKKTLLNETSLELLTTFDDADYGLGMIKSSKGYIGHGGNNLGYAYREYYNRENKNLILYFSNAHMVPFDKMIRNELFDFMEGKISSATFKNNIAAEYKHAIGIYEFDAAGLKMDIEILEEEDNLYILAQGAKVLLVSTEQNKLVNGTFGVELEIDPSNVDQLTFRQNGLETTIKRIKS
ncbi:serine hydrolase domain-containing protein [Flagellimonas sp.]|uniref:serine hydrolase domain-containing protein n=1 Tax=Flagellimonas sp. TaxID=2058762 RepID=UPI003B597FAA